MSGVWGDRDTLTVMVPRNHIRQFDVSTGWHSNAGKGATIGLGLGAAAGLAAGIACASSSPGHLFSGCDVGQIGFLTVLGAAVVTPVGALVGVLAGGERWEPVTPTHAHVMLAPHGVGLAVSLPL